VSGTFLNTQFFLDGQTKFSSIDMLFLLEADLSALQVSLFTYMVYDHSLCLDRDAVHLNVIFYTDYQDFFTLLLHHSPELVTAINNFCEAYHLNLSLLADVATLFDGFSDNLTQALSEFLEYLLLVLGFF